MCVGNSKLMSCLHLNFALLMWHCTYFHKRIKPECRPNWCHYSLVISPLSRRLGNVLKVQPFKKKTTYELHIFSIKISVCYVSRCVLASICWPYRLRRTGPPPRLSGRRARPSPAPRPSPGSAHHGPSSESSISTDSLLPPRGRSSSSVQSQTEPNYCCTL